MIDLQSSLLNFYKQFTPSVFLENYVQFYDDSGNPREPQLKDFPYITMSYATSDFATSTLSHFQIWDRATHFGNILEIAGKIEKAIPVLSGITLDVRNIDNGELVGAIQLYRGAPFIQPRNTDDQMLKTYYGNVEIRSHIF